MKFDYAANKNLYDEYKLNSDGEYLSIDFKQMQIEKSKKQRLEVIIGATIVAVLSICFGICTTVGYSKLKTSKSSGVIGYNQANSVTSATNIRTASTALSFANATRRMSKEVRRTSIFSRRDSKISITSGRGLSGES